MGINLDIQITDEQEIIESTNKIEDDCKVRRHK